MRASGRCDSDSYCSGMSCPGPRSDSGRTPNHRRSASVICRLLMLASRRRMSQVKGGTQRPAALHNRRGIVDISCGSHVTRSC